MFCAVEFLAEIVILYGGLVYQVYFSAQQLLKFIDKVEESQKQIGYLVVIENYGEVDVALVVEARRQYGAEYP